MSSSILERTRALYEAAELSEQAIVEQLNSKPNGQKAKVWQQHKLRKLMESISADSRLVSEFFDDVNGVCRAEVQQMKGSQMFDTFYSAVNSTQEYYARFPHLNIPSEGTVLPEPEVSVAFSGEEVFGKYLDLHRFFVQFSNLPGLQAAQEELDYIQYLDKFSSFFYIKEQAKNTKQYRAYVHELSEYLTDFFKRVQPLVNHQEIVETLRAEFDGKWAAGQISGWKGPSSSSSAAPPQPLRLGMFNSVEELEALGLDRLKQALEALGLKCGGTLKDRAERLWSVRGKKPEDIPAKLRAPTSAKKAEDETVDLRKQV
jgi:splicing factor 3A subunit 3